MASVPVFESPFDVPGEWYRGNLHCHTTGSDGAMPPEGLVAHYAHAGWDFLAITDHWALTRVPAAAVPPSITLIPGIEVGTASGSTLAGTDCHIVGLDVREALPRRDDLGAGAAQWYLDAIREQGGAAHLAHPYWNSLSVGDVAPLRGYYALEVYNADTEVLLGRGLSQMLWDDLLTRGIAARAIAVDDSHLPGYDSLRAWTVVRAPDRSPGAIMGALRAGHFYASSGPQILDLRWEPADYRGGLPCGGTVTVRCSPARAVTLVADAFKGSRLSRGPLGMAFRARHLPPTPDRPQGGHPHEPLTGAVFTLQGTERYARVQVEDEQGRCAWSNPLFVHPAPDREAPAQSTGTRSGERSA